MPTTPRPTPSKPAKSATRSRPRADAHRVLLLSLSDLSRRVRVHRSTVTRAAQGPLSAAMVGDRIDLAHPVVVAWIRDRVPRPPAPACGGCGAFAGTPYVGISQAEFVRRAEVPPDVVYVALGGELAPALLPSGRLDIGHPASLAFLARYPLARSAFDDPLDPPIDGHDFTCPAHIDENRHDVRHPVYQAFLARYFGRIPTDDDCAEFPSP